MFASGYKGGGSDVRLNGLPSSQYYAQNPFDQPTHYYDDTHPYDGTVTSGVPISSSTAPAAPAPATATPTTPTTPPALASLPGQLSPSTMYALQGFDSGFGSSNLPSGPMPPSAPAPAAPAAPTPQPRFSFNPGGSLFGRNLFGLNLGSMNAYSR